MTKYKEIKGITQEELETRFPWLKEAKFENAIVSVDKDGCLVWHRGTWKSGI